MSINIIFPAYPGDNKKIDPFWEKEAEAAKAVGFGISLLAGSHFGPGLSIHSFNDHDRALYRGWIIKKNTYEEMTTLEPNLLNSYNDYLWSLDFPKWYNDFPSGETPNSFYYISDEIISLGLPEIAEQVADKVGHKSLMIKDWLKSRKHEWFDACFIRDAADIEESLRIMNNFFKLQGRDFYGGLVFRDFLSLKMAGIHPKSNMPVPVEFRTFFLNKKPFFTCPYWTNDITYPENIETPSQEWLGMIGSHIKSPFVALDIAQEETGKWTAIECNDGGSSGLPDHVDMKGFYQILFNGLK